MLLFETHLHTDESSSCGQVPAQEQVAYYKRGGYDGIIVTDHFQPRDRDRISGKYDWEKRIELQHRGFEIAKQFETPDFTVLWGMEIRFKGFDNDYLVYGADREFFLEHPDLTESDIETFSRLVHEHGGIALFQAHPMRDDMTLVEPKLLDGIEVYNGNSSHNSRNEIAEHWADFHGLRKLSGSDCHTPWMAAPGGIRLERRPKDEKDFAQMLLNNEYKLKNQED